MASGPWLSYSDGEVPWFHPAFEESAKLALAKAGLDSSYEWVHHPPVGLARQPDFVLRRRIDGRWILIVEVKRTKEDVVSQRLQSQPKSYAETFQSHYPPDRAKYFAMTNIEQSIVFALNGSRPPVECQLQGGVFSSGDFANQSKASQQSQFVDNLVGILRLVTTAGAPVFDVVWPSILDDFVNFATSLEGFPEVTSSWALPIGPSSRSVASYFGAGSIVDAARVFIFRCLVAEYLRGILRRVSHPDSGKLTVVRAASSASQTATRLASAIDNLRSIDFDVVFDSRAAAVYRSLSDPGVKQRLHDYVDRITRPPTRVFELARTRTDHRELMETLFSKLYPPQVQDDTGKVQTDPELARVLAALAITRPDENVVDPCCGEGSLLSAAYEHLDYLGASGTQAIKSVSGIEIDPLAAYLASLRIALKRASVLSPTENVDIRLGDLFASAVEISNADVILMNPPFKRYEDQGSRPIPPALRKYFNGAIEQVDGVPARTTGGQANLFAYYVEFVVKAAKEGATVGIVLDNKWFQNKIGESLRGFLLDHCEINAIVAYPRNNLFKDFTIATSLLIATKESRPDPKHQVRFVQSKVEPGSVDIAELTAAFHAGATWPSDWMAHAVLQSQLDKKDRWKRYFASTLAHDYRSGLPRIQDLFRYLHRGSLDKEEGGVSVLGFPFGRTSYGSKRTKHPNGRRGQTVKGRKLTSGENDQLRGLAARVPSRFRGLALKNANDVSGYEVTQRDAERVQTIEPPRLRGNAMFFSAKRVPWQGIHDAALIDMKTQKALGAFITAVDKIIGLNSSVVPEDHLWVVLREPVAGELIIPRKTRVGHRVHINPFAFNPKGRQIRISSNFFSYSNCTAVDPASGLDRGTATRLIAAFLMSSFGHLQFELEGLDREGLLSLDEHSLSRIVVFDPRWVRSASRQAILDAFAALPYRVRTDLPSSQQTERNSLDDLFADEIVAKFPQFDKSSLLRDVHSLLDVWTDVRQQ